MNHYVCPTCGGVSEVLKVCETEGCSRKGQMLKDCNCTDDTHSEVKEDQKNL